MINARIAGTALHLNINKENIETSQISYKKYRIWGIKTLVKYLVEDIFNIFYKNLPVKEEQLNPEKNLVMPLKTLCKRYKIPFETVLKFIEKRKEPKQIWESMDNDLRAVFMINAFFEAFEYYIVETYYIAMSLARFFLLKPGILPKLKRSDFGLKDFGFVHRARGYSLIFSKYIYNNAFSNTVNRLNNTLLNEYLDTFIYMKPDQSEKKDDIWNIEELPEEKRYVLEMLKEGNATEKLEAINLIVENGIVEGINDLEYLLNHKEEKVMNAAFDAIVILKNLD